MNVFSNNINLKKINSTKSNGSKWIWMCLPAVVACTLLCTQVQAAGAQWVWKNAKGSKVYSDTPPPASVPKSRIIKSPRQAAVAGQKRRSKLANKPVGLVDAKVARGEVEDASTEVEGSNEKGEKTAKNSMSELDKKLEAKRKKKEAKEKAQKQAEEEKIAEERRARQEKNCKRIEQAKRNLRSGSRISAVGEDGEKRYLSQDEVQSRLEQLAEAEESNEC